MAKFSTIRQRWLLAGVLGLSVMSLIAGTSGTARNAPADEPKAYANDIQPLLKNYCLDCHSEKAMKGELDLERFSSVTEARKDLRPWPLIVEMLENGEMPPKGKPQPTAEERKRLIAWTKSFIDTEARARAGDPGKVVLRRLNNAEYNYTTRDLTGVGLQPTREFPADGAAGEGFTNTGETLVMSPALLSKFLIAAKEITSHAVLLPDGFRFSPVKTQNDWTNESIAELRKTYKSFNAGPDDGRLDFKPYLSATIRYRDELLAGKIAIDAVAEKEKLSPKYLSILWQTLTDKQPSAPLDQICLKWRQAEAKDVEAVAAEIRAWQGLLWKFNKVGSYVNEVWQDAGNPAMTDAHAIKFKPKLTPGQNEVVLYLVSRKLSGPAESRVVWQRPRFEGGKLEPLLLRGLATFSEPYEAASHAILADTAKYLNAAIEPDAQRGILDDLAKKHQLDPVVLKNWINYLHLAVAPKEAATPEIPLHLLTRKTDAKPAIKGWAKEAADSLPAILSNGSNVVEKVPGTVDAHRVCVHPTPTEFVGVVWNSQVEGAVRVSAKIAHVHPSCGNGISWWVEHRHGSTTTKLEGGNIDLGKKTDMPARELKVTKGDQILLAIGARDGNHICDLTQVDLTIDEMSAKPRRWDLASDVADTITEGNPHADKLGNKEVWSFVRGADPTGKNPVAKKDPKLVIPQGSMLAQWRTAAVDPKKRDELGKLAEQVRDLLIGKMTTTERTSDRMLYDSLLSLDGPLFQGIDLAQRKTTGAAPKISRFGVPNESFKEANLAVPVPSVIEVRLPAAIFKDREFVIEGKADPAAVNSIVQFEILSNPPDLSKPAAAGTPWVGSGDFRGANPKQMQEGFDAFRKCFPVFLHHNKIVPDDEVVCLRLYFREDENLVRLFLNDEQKRRLDRLWEEHRFISQWPITEHKNLPLFIGFVTQDQPKSSLIFFEGKREPFRKRADEFEKEVESAVAKQLAALIDFAAKAYRRPLLEQEKTELLAIYQLLRTKDMAHDEAFRKVLTRVLMSPSFMYRLEQPPAGKVAKPVTDAELATRLSYFLWSTLPDAELTKAAAEGRLRDPKVLAEQTSRMLKDDRIRALAVEFGTQWLHVRAFDELKEKNEKLFPTFNDNLRKTINEESVLFFKDLFQNDRSYQNILDADYAYLNELLAKHYGIPGVNGPQWRKVDGVKKYGRGGILGLASVQTKESGASRTSPVLRGNWVAETLLNDRLPRPPANVPRLPEDEKGNDGLTMRQLTEKHTRVAECAVCHVRIDPYGFALEKYDPIGRLRDKDLGGLPVDAKAKLRDGTEFEGIDGLRDYLLTKKKDVFVRSFCKKLLGYSLGRSTMVSDQPLIEEMIAEMNKNEGHLSAAVLTIVRSPQFRMIRGMEFAE